MADTFGRKSDTVIFQHTPKCGGMTLRDVAGTQYRHSRIFRVEQDKKAALERFKQFSRHQRRRYDLIMGHQAIKLMDYVESPIVFMMFRQPVDRVISLYYYAKRRDHPMHVLTNKYDLEEFFRQGCDKDWPECSNGQYRALAEVLQCKRLNVPSGEPMQKLKDIIQKYFIFGLVERFDESLFLFKEALSWNKPIYYRKKNVSRYEKNYSEWLIEHIREQNAKDIELYDFVKREFDKAVVAGGPKLQRRITNFQACNTYFGVLFSMHRKVQNYFARR